MIIIQLFDLFLFLIKKISYNDFVLTFSYIAILCCIFKMLRDLIHVD